mgnify:CR=1 FL=1
MKIKIQSIENFFAVITILLFPMISSFGYAPKFLGGLGSEGAFYPAFILMVFVLILLIHRGNLALPKFSSIAWLYLFLVIAFLSILVNIDTLFSLYYQGTFAVNRAIVQYGSLLVYVGIALSFFYFFSEKENSLSFFSKWIIGAAIISACYSFFELGALFNNSICLEIRTFLDSLFRANESVSGLIATYERGIRSMTAEASYLALFSGISLPWILSSMILSHGIKKLLLGCLVIFYIILNLFSVSRTAYFVFGIEIFIWLLVMRRLISLKLVFEIILGITLFLVSFTQLFPNNELLGRIDISKTIESVFTNDMQISASNVARYGSQQAALGIFYDHPIFGVGYGEFGYYAADYYPNEAWLSNEIQTWGLNSSPGTWPMSHNLYARLLCDTGILGGIVWFFFELTLVYKLFTTANRLSNKCDTIYMKSLAISIIGIMVFSITSDAMRIIALWVIIGLSWSQLSLLSKNKIDD